MRDFTGRYLYFFLFFFCIACSEDEVPIVDTKQNLTIFFINDQHGQLNNFSRIKHIVDQEISTNPNVLLMSAGDIFSGNPIVDQYSEKGYPIIDIMNLTGFDISVIGNHEFDYGQDILRERLEQANFEWVCANINTENSILPQPAPYKTLEVGDLKVTVLGLVETNGSPDILIPSTHPWRVLDLEFFRFYDIVDQYMNLKQQQDADLFVALTHLGSASDLYLARNYPYFDLIIGGHSNDLMTEKVNGIPVLQAGNYLSHLGRIDLTIENKEVVDYTTELIDLNSYPHEDEALKAIINEYNNAPQFFEVVGYANSLHDRTELGCFYTAALKEYFSVDCSFQNPGGIRNSIDEGDITKMEIYQMDPFNNGSVIFTLSAREIKDFFIDTGVRLHTSGIYFEKSGQELLLYDDSGLEYNDTDMITIGINDYIPAVYSTYFPLEKAQILNVTTAEAIIQYLETMNNTISYDGCNQLYNFQ